MRKISPPAGFAPRTFQPLASRCLGPRRNTHVYFLSLQFFKQTFYRRTFKHSLTQWCVLQQPIPVIRTSEITEASGFCFRLSTRYIGSKLGHKFAQHYKIKCKISSQFGNTYQTVWSWRWWQFKWRSFVWPALRN